LYFLATFLVPVSKAMEQVDFADYFYTHKKYIFLTTALLLLTMSFKGQVFKGEDILSVNNYYRVSGVVITLSLAYLDNRKVHAVAPLVLIILLLSFIGSQRFHL